MSGAHAYKLFLHEGVQSKKLKVWRPQASPWYSKKQQLELNTQIWSGNLSSNQPMLFKSLAYLDVSVNIQKKTRYLNRGHLIWGTKWKGV